jgi:hypothetical protein
VIEKMISAARTIAVECVVEENGSHLHRYTVKGIGMPTSGLVVEQDFHTALSTCHEPTAGFPDRYALEVQQEHAELAETLAGLVRDGLLPELACQVESYPFPTPVARVLAALAEPLPAVGAADRREHEALGYLMRGVAEKLEAEAAKQEEEQTRGIYRARAGALRWEARLSIETAQALHWADEIGI